MKLVNNCILHISFQLYIKKKLKEYKDLQEKNDEIISII